MLIATLAFALIQVTSCSTTKTPIQQTTESSFHDEASFEGVVLLSAKQSDGAFGLRNDYLPLWNPPENVFIKALKGLPKYLDSRPEINSRYAQELPGLRQRLARTVCQAVGVSLKGKKGILLNCLPSEGQFSGGWKTRFIKVYDGGPRYWSVVYLVDEERFTNFKIDLGY